jgi:uncharacterized protein (DUF1684 family)
MQKTALYFTFLILLFSCSEKKEVSYSKKLTSKRAFFEASFGGAASILSPEDKNNFKGLDYYKVDTGFLFEAKVLWEKNPNPIKLYKDSNEFGVHFPVAKLQFEINHVSYELIGFSSELTEIKTLFVPFLDETSGYETYGGGRFLDVEVESYQQLTLDFNMAYNPYCAYNPNYICAKPPASNNLKVKILAGEKRPLFKIQKQKGF